MLSSRLSMSLQRAAVLSQRASVRLMSSASSGDNTIGFIGLGQMGARMAANLVKKGKSVIVYDLNAEAVKSLEALGAKSAPTVAELAKKSDAIVTMLPATQHVASTLSGPNGVLANARPGTLIIDSSTIDPVACKNMHEQVRAAGMRMLDAPVSGGVGGAEAGTLTFMVGGDAADLARGKPLLDLMGKNVVHCGDGGAGEVAKLCNNLALAIQMVGVSEAMALGVRMGMDPKVLAGVMNTSTGRSWSCDTYNPCPGVMPNVPSSRGYTGGFAVALMEKDLGLALDAGRQSKTRLPLGSAAGQLYGLLLEHGYGGKDFSSVYEFITKSGSGKA